MLSATKAVLPTANTGAPASPQPPATITPAQRTIIMGGTIAAPIGIGQRRLPTAASPEEYRVYPLCRRGHTTWSRLLAHEAPHLIRPPVAAILSPMDLALAHLLAAGISFVAMADAPRLFYDVVRVFMVLLGGGIAYSAAMAGEPLEVVAGLSLVVLIFAVFTDRSRILWPIITPLVSLGYLVHVSWLGLKALGLA